MERNIGNPILKQILALAGIAFAAASCASNEATPGSVPPRPTDNPTATVASSATLTALPTQTPAPTATRTPRPTHTPIPNVAFSNEAAEQDYVVPLTVQRLNSFEALTHFELEQPTQGWLLYRPDGMDLKSWWAIPLAEDSAIHQIPLVGLTPGETYFAQVGLGSSLETLTIPRLFGTEWGPIKFDTPELGTPDLRFAVVGDSGFGDDQTRELIELMSSYKLDFVLHTGDSVYRANEESGPQEAFARKYFKMFSSLIHEVPVFPVLGNHDYDGAARFEGRPYFVRAFPSHTDPSVPDNALGAWYAFDFSDVQFLMLDTQAFHGGGGRAEQTAWLEQRLADPNYRLSIPVFHTPPYTSGRHTNDGAAVRSDWIPLFEASNVPITLSGHDHNYERIKRNGVTYVVTGGGSPVLYRETERVEGSEKFQRRMHFTLIDVFAEHIRITAVDLDGSVLDLTTIPITTN